MPLWIDNCVVAVSAPDGWQPPPVDFRIKNCSYGLYMRDRIEVAKALDMTTTELDRIVSATRDDLAGEIDPDRRFNVFRRMSLGIRLFAALAGDLDRLRDVFERWFGPV